MLLIWHAAYLILTHFAMLLCWTC